MGFEFLIVIGTVFMLPFVAAGFVAFWMTNHRDREAIEAVWEAYAARRVREYVPARGEWPNRSSPAVRWRKGGVRFELSVVGRETRARTRLAAWPRERLLGTFVAGTRLPRRGATPVPTFDAVFQRTFTIDEDTPGIASRVLVDGARRALLGFSQREQVLLRYRLGRLRLEWTGRESNDARIDEAERVLLVLAESLDRSFDDRSTC